MDPSKLRRHQQHDGYVETTPAAILLCSCVQLCSPFCPISVLPAPRAPAEPLTPPSSLSLAGGRVSPSLFDSWSRKSKIRSSFTTALRDDSLSSERLSRLQQEKQMLMEEVKAQKVIRDPGVGDFSYSDYQ